MKVLIKKLETRSDAENPDAFLPTDYESTKNINPDKFNKPKVDTCFILHDINSMNNYFRSSIIVEILENNETSGKFKTINSIYYWEILT